MSSKILKDAIDDLGRYYGLRSADEYLNTILGNLDKGSFPGLSSDSDSSTTPNLRGKLLNAISCGGDTSFPTTEALMKFINECVNGKPGPDSESNGNLMKQFNQDICITPHSDSEGSLILAWPSNELSVSVPDGEAQDQGLGNPKNGEYWTVNDLREKDLPNADDPTNTTKVNVIQVFPAAGNVSNSDSDVASLFLSAIPTLEYSRAVPFLDVLLLSPIPDDKNKTRPFSLGRFIMGTNVDSETKMLQQQIHAEDPSIFHSLNSGIDDEDAKADSLRTAATMEIFTSPQTMVPLANIEYQDMGVAFGGVLDGGGRDYGNAFSSFMSIEQVKINVAPGGTGMFSFKTADIGLKLHDKTRLGDISPLVVPAERNNVQFVITYGWSHPLPDGRLPDAKANRFGSLIDAMKITETFQVYNSDMTFEANGEVSIGLKLHLLGASGIDNLDITIQEVSDVASELNKVVTLINKTLDEYSEELKSRGGKIAIPKYVSAAGNLSSARTMKTADISKTYAWLNVRKGKSDLLRNVNELTKELLGKKKNGKYTNGLVTDLVSTKESAIEKIIKQLQNTPDPWLRPVGTYDGKFNSKRWPRGRTEKTKANGGSGRCTQKVISLGKLITYFVGESVRTNNQFSEVQLVFHAFNESASYLFDCNIAQFPILLTDLETILKARFNSYGKMSMGAFVNLIQTFFINDPAAMGYGFAKAYGARNTKEKLAQRKSVAKTKTPKYPGVSKGSKKFVLADYQRYILLQAYGTPGEMGRSNVSFKQPQLNIKIQASPCRNGIDEGPGAPAQPGKPILRMQIFDSQCNTTESLYDVFDAFTSSGITGKMKRENTGTRRHPRHQEIIENQYEILGPDNLGLVEKFKVDSDLETETGLDAKTLEDLAKDKYILKPNTIGNLKEAFHKLVPSLIYGSAQGGFIDAKLKTQNDPAMTTIGILGANKPEKDKEVGEQQIPMQILPTMLDMETLGCPYVTFGQSFFVDFNTNSSADNFYTVFGVSHTISPGEYKTSIKFANQRTYARYTTPFDSVADLALRVHKENIKKKNKKKKKK